MDPYARVLVTGCGEVNVCDSARKKQSVWIVTIVLTCVLSGLAGFLLRNVIPEGMVAPGGQRDR